MPMLLAAAHAHRSWCCSWVFFGQLSVRSGKEARLGHQAIDLHTTLKQKPRLFLSACVYTMSAASSLASNVKGPSVRPACQPLIADVQLLDSPTGRS